MSGILVILIAILFCAFFSGMEIAYISSNKLRLELDIKQGDFSSGILKFFAKNPGQYIATMLVGNNVGLVIYGIFFSRLLNPVLTPLFGSDLLVFIVNTIISTAVILFVAEFLPKTTVILAPNSFLKTLSLPTLVFFWLFYPVSKFAVLSSNLLIRIFSKNKPVSMSHENIVFSKVDLDHFVGQSRERDESATPHHHNIKIFQNALDFSSVKLRECMVPRTEIEAVECNSSIADLKERFIETQHSRILVFQESIDNIIGYFDLKDIFRNPPDIKSSIRKLAIVPETMAANKLLKVFVDEKKNVALVVDEFGGTSGMVTIEDVLEEIVGDIEDEHDTQELIEKVISRNEYIFSGRLEIDYLNEKYHLRLPEEDDYETLAGMILYFHGSIPGNNDVIRIKNLVFRILKVSSTRVELINIKVE
jgi:CBS domain containing-hemolysin-like protein